MHVFASCRSRGEWKKLSLFVREMFFVRCEICRIVLIKILTSILPCWCVKTVLRSRKLPWSENKHTSDWKRDEKLLPLLHTSFMSWHRWSASDKWFFSRALFCRSDWCSLAWRLNTRWHICSWLVQTGRNDTFAVVGWFFLWATFISPSRFLAAPAAKRASLGSPASPGLNEKEPGRWHGVSRGLSCDPDFCTSLCPGGQRRFSSFRSPRADLLLQIQREREPAEKKSLWVLLFVHATGHALLIFFWEGKHANEELTRFLSVVYFFCLPHLKSSCRFELWTPAAAQQEVTTRRSHTLSLIIVSAWSSELLTLKYSHLNKHKTTYMTVPTWKLPDHASGFQQQNFLMRFRRQNDFSNVVHVDCVTGSWLNSLMNSPEWRPNQTHPAPAKSVDFNLLHLSFSHEYGRTELLKYVIA